MGVPFSFSCADEAPADSSVTITSVAPVAVGEGDGDHLRAVSSSQDQTAASGPSPSTGRGFASADRVPRKTNGTDAPSPKDAKPATPAGSAKRKPMTTFATVLSYSGVPGQRQRAVVPSTQPSSFSSRVKPQLQPTSITGNSADLTSFSMALTDEPETTVVTGILGEVSEDYEVTTPGRSSIAVPEATSPCPQF